MPKDIYRGVDVTDKIEAVTACNSCRWMHDIEPLPHAWEGEAGG